MNDNATAVINSPDAERAQALAERVFGASIATLEIASIYVGDRLGLYRSLAAEGPATFAELAHRTGTAPRYIREWLEQQAAAGFVETDDASLEPGKRRFVLPEAHRSVFTDADSLSYLAPLTQLSIGVLAPIETLIDAYRTGGGVPYADYGQDTREGIERLNRPMFLSQLAGWLKAIPDVDARLSSQPPARVADLACGSAWSSIAIARAYPGAQVDAIDLDEASIDLAVKNVASAGLAGRVHARVEDASNPKLSGRYDLVTIFEALHDMAHPVEALKAARAMLAAGGSVLVGDERVAERFSAPGDELERFNYGWSVLHCLPAGLTEANSAGTGTVMRPDTLRSYAAAAGFGKVEVLPIEHDFWLFYRLMP